MGNENFAVFLYDIRKRGRAVTINAHLQPVLSVAFNPFDGNLLASASRDQTIALWDMRNTSQPLHSLVGHKGEIYSATWNPSNPHILASAGVDRRVNLWDISKVGFDFTTFYNILIS